MIVCADDYGLRNDVDDAILTLCKGGKLSAVSCMVALERCDRTALERLLCYETTVDIGLHLCLTHEGLPWAAQVTEILADAPGFGALLRTAVLRQIDQSQIHRQVMAQFNLFIERIGRPPDHLDGHLHAHQLPCVREALVSFLLGLPKDHRPYVRNTALPRPQLRRHKLPWFKASFIGFFGTRMLERLHQAGLRTNQGFSGIYDFKHWLLYPRYLPRFVDCLTTKPNAVLVVHPGGVENWRKQEFSVLQNYEFPDGAPNRFS